MQGSGLAAARRELDLAPRVKLGQDEPTRSPALNWEELDGKEPPAREWCIDHWLPAGHVTLLSGAPGSGKTLVAQAIGSCLTNRFEYLDFIPSQQRVLMWACEDDEAELWRRQVAIAKWQHESLASFSDKLFVHSYEGRAVELAVRRDQQLVATPMLAELEAQIRDYRASVVILDNIARLFGGNENDRHEVTSFVAMLAGAARETKASVLLIGHTGKAAGSEYSGSTAWEGAVRARLYLGTKLPDEDPANEELPEDGVRYLCRRKANYSAQDWRRVRYVDGVLIPDEPVEGRTSTFSDEFVTDVVLRIVRKLTEMGEPPMAGTRSPHYMPKLARQYKLTEGVSEKRLAEVMRVLQTSGRLVKKTVGRYGNGNSREGLAVAS
jgi:RecA-family ATPase